LNNIILSFSVSNTLKVFSITEHANPFTPFHWRTMADIGVSGTFASFQYLIITSLIVLFSERNKYCLNLLFTVSWSNHLVFIENKGVCSNRLSLAWQTRTRAFSWKVTFRRHEKLAMDSCNLLPFKHFSESKKRCLTYSYVNTKCINDAVLYKRPIEIV